MNIPAILDQPGFFCHLLQRMSEFATVVGAVLPVFAIAVVGFLIRRLNWLTEEADQSLLKMNINLLFPCLIMDAALGNPAVSRAENLIMAPLAGFGTVVLGLTLGWAARWFNGLKGTAGEGTFAVTVGIYNYSYIPLPLAALLFGQSTIGVLFVHNVGVEIAMWTLGVMLLSGTGIGTDWRKIVNAPLIAILVAVILNALGMESKVPKPVLTGLQWLGQCAIPMSLILIGAVVSDYLKEFHTRSGLRVIAVAVALRLFVLPCAFLLLARVLPVSTELKQVMILQAAMPSAVFPIVMSRHYGGDPPTALRVVIGTSLVGLVTIPLWIKVGLKLVGGT
jgi:predicted permease